jgi:uncharacterized protein (TIGR02246 family)
MRVSRKSFTALNELRLAIGLALTLLSFAGCFPRAQKSSKVADAEIPAVSLSAYAIDSVRGKAVIAIGGERRRLEEGIRSNDAAAMADVYAPDAFFFPPGGDRISGRAAIRRSFERTTRDYEIVHVVHEVDVQGDLAYEIGRWIQRRKSDGAAIGGGGYLWLWKRQPDGRWAIWREVWNDGPSPLAMTGEHHIIRGRAVV